jgi:hypothetical protein
MVGALGVAVAVDDAALVCGHAMGGFTSTTSNPGP